MNLPADSGGKLSGVNSRQFQTHHALGRSRHRRKNNPLDTNEDNSFAAMLLTLRSPFVTGVNHANYKLSYPSMAGASAISLSGDIIEAESGDVRTLSGSFDVTAPHITRINFPALVTIGSDLTMSGNSTLTTFSLPALLTIVGIFAVTGLTGLTSISVPLLQGASEILITGNPALTTFHVGPSFLCVAIDLSGNALHQASVDALLLALQGLDGGTLNISGGTNAAPSAAGLLNKATLISNGWTITTN